LLREFLEGGDLASWIELPLPSGAQQPAAFLPGRFLGVDSVLDREGLRVQPENAEALEDPVTPERQESWHRPLVGAKRVKSTLLPLDPASLRLGVAPAWASFYLIADLVRLLVRERHDVSLDAE